MTLSKTVTTIIASTAACAMLPAMAAIKTDTVEKTMEISIAGYDLTSATDAQALLASIEKAAERVCKISSNRSTVREMMLRRACEENAIAQTVESLDAPQVSAAYEDQSS